MSAADFHSPPNDALQITEYLLRMPPPYSSGLVRNRPHIQITHTFRLFQAKMWRYYAQKWNLPDWNLDRIWVEQILQHSRNDCIRRAKVNLYLAKRLRREKV